jgi:hypothetical protein
VILLNIQSVVLLAVLKYHVRATYLNKSQCGVQFQHEFQDVTVSSDQKKDYNSLDGDIVQNNIWLLGTVYFI